MTMPARGITLVEMLVALLLGGIATAGALTGLSGAQRAWSEASQQARLHERAQYVFATLEPELQMAGYFGMHPAPALSSEAAAAPGLRACGADLATLAPALVVRQGSWPTTCSAQGGGALPATQRLVAKRAAVATTLSPGAITLPGYLPDEPARELRVRIFYVARRSDGDARAPALRVKSLSAVAGEPAFIDTEVMSGVEDLQIELLPSPAAARTARVRLRLVGEDAGLPRRAQSPSLEITRRFALRNAST